METRSGGPARAGGEPGERGSGGPGGAAPGGEPGPVVVFLGSPGVGKGTQGARLSRELGWAHVSTGDLLRDARSAGAPLGREAKTYMDSGRLVPDDLMLALLGEKLASMPPVQGMILDGFPRTEAQAVALDEALGKAGRRVGRVVLLDAPEPVLVKRISGRRLSSSGRVYNVHYDPPRREGICDDTGEPLAHREDDRPEAVRTRLAVYRETTAPLVGHYGRRGLLSRVDGEGGIDEVQRALRSAVEG